MADLMPTSVQCCRCSRQFPVRAQMNLGSGDKIPMLVVLSQVDSVEAALEQATCQVCLGKTGPADRGLHEVLKALGLKDEEDMSTPPREAAVVVHVREDHAAPTMGVVISDARPREVTIVDPLMGTSIQVTRLALPARRRGDGQRRDDRDPASIEPPVPHALREAGLVSESSVPVVHLTGAIEDAGDNAAVLEAAKAGIRQRDEERLRERAKAFDKLMFYLRLTLAKIRKNAATSEVWGLVETFERKLGEAVAFDAQQRGKKGLFAELGASAEELEDLCCEFYMSQELLRPRRPIEVVTIDAFEGGRRPESWDGKGGRKPAFYEFEVVRTENSLPIPNPPLSGGDEDPRPRIVYPQDGQYGPDYTVEHSKILAGVEDKIDQICESLPSEFLRWLARYHEQLFITTEMTRLHDDLVELLEAFLAFQRLERQDAPAAIEPADSDIEVVDITTSPELPANT